MRKGKSSKYINFIGKNKSSLKKKPFGSKNNKKIAKLTKKDPEEKHSTASIHSFDYFKKKSSINNLSKIKRNLHRKTQSISSAATVFHIKSYPNYQTNNLTNQKNDLPEKKEKLNQFSKNEALHEPEETSIYQKRGLATEPESESGELYSRHATSSKHISKMSKLHKFADRNSAVSSFSLKSGTKKKAHSKMFSKTTKRAIKFGKYNSKKNNSLRSVLETRRKQERKKSNMLEFLKKKNS